ncbi:MAG TPA: MEKHLA domain-containing protein [Chthoniobacterales bacterium]|nr:MEKHLA domain-containing protein [Chthoniobacterales bacterium]
MDLRNDLSFSDLLAGSYFRLTGRSLIPNRLMGAEAAKWLYEAAPFGVLAHNTASDPIFVYGNRAAQRLFEYEWDELITLPSRLSAEAPDREERQCFLEQVESRGFITGYRGIRISKSGRRFRIENATVWQLIGTDGKCHGQAAMIPQTLDLEPGTNPR